MIDELRKVDLWSREVPNPWDHAPDSSGCQSFTDQQKPSMVGLQGLPEDTSKSSGHWHGPCSSYH